MRLRAGAIIPFLLCGCGMPDGQGTKTWPDGSKYVGEWRSGTMHGQGTLTLPDGTTFAGEWRNDKMYGQGIATMPDGTMFAGELATLATYRYHLRKGFFERRPRHLKYVGVTPDDEWLGQNLCTVEVRLTATNISAVLDSPEPATLRKTDAAAHVGEWRDSKFLGPSERN